MEPIRSKFHDDSLCMAKVFHARNFPRRNAFNYKVFYVLLDLDNLKKSQTKFFSINKFNLFSFYEKDRLQRENKELNAGLKTKISEILKKENLDKADGKIMLICHPRILGYAFNPVSFWFFFNKQNQLIAVLAEVNNTFGETHSYLIHNHDQSPILKDQEHFAKKEFHVSPFLKRKGHYRFRFDFSEEKIVIFIDYFDEEKLMLNTSLIAKRNDLKDFNLLKAFFHIPFLTLKVIFLIHFQAIKLVLKRIKYIPKPQQLLHKITKNFDE